MLHNESLQRSARVRSRLAMLAPALGGLLLPAVIHSQSTNAQTRTIPPAFTALSSPVARELSGDRARATVAFVEQFFRLPGNRGFDASIDTVAALLAIAGYVPEAKATPSDRLVFRVESRPMTAPAWTPDD